MLSPGRSVAGVHLARCSPLSAASVEFALDGGGGGVNLGAVGRALGLDPSTVLLNGYYLSRGPDLVSAGVTWDVLLAFFIARGMPDGGSAGDAIVVQGRPLLPLPPVLHCHSAPEDSCHRTIPRKVLLEDESPCKKLTVICDSGEIDATEVQTDDGNSCWNRRKLILEDNSPCKKPKVDSAPHLVLAAALKTGITCNEISEKGTEDRISPGSSLRVR